MKTPRNILNHISTFDPDGQDFGEAGPSTNDYLNFEASVLAEYGKPALDDYYSESWSNENGTYE